MIGLADQLAELPCIDHRAGMILIIGESQFEPALDWVKHRLCAWNIENVDIDKVVEVPTRGYGGADIGGLFHPRGQVRQSVSDRQPDGIKIERPRVVRVKFRDWLKQKAEIPESRIIERRKSFAEE